MDKKDLFDALDDFSQTLLVTLAEVEAVKKKSQECGRGKYCSASGK